MDIKKSASGRAKPPKALVYWAFSCIKDGVKVDIVLTKSISRFARNTVDLLETVRHLKETGVEVWFERENIHSMDGDGELMLSILASFAQEESRSISENVTWGHRKRMADGRVAVAYSRFIGYDKGPDFLTKKQVINHGEIPQYYVENSHEAIIEPAVFDRVQDMIKERSRRKGYSGVTIFSSKIKCGCCGGWYGSKVWHSTDRYRRVVWQCNAKFKDKTHCTTPHLTEDEIKEAFVSVVNQLITDRNEILDELRTVQSTPERRRLRNSSGALAEQMNVDNEAVQDIIAENARVAQDQDAYRVRYETLVSRFEGTKAEYDKVTEEIRMRGIRRREFGRFIAEVEKLPKAVTDFDEALWGALVDHLTVYSKDNIVFTLNSVMEIKA